MISGSGDGDGGDSGSACKTCLHALYPFRCLRAELG